MSLEGACSGCPPHRGGGARVGRHMVREILRFRSVQNMDSEKAKVVQTFSIGGLIAEYVRMNAYRLLQIPVISAIRV